MENWGSPGGMQPLQLGINGALPLSSITSLLLLQVLLLTNYYGGLVPHHTQSTNTSSGVGQREGEEADLLNRLMKPSYVSRGSALRT